MFHSARTFRLAIIIVALAALNGGKSHAQINTEQVMNIGRNALYFEDYILSIQYFNQVIQQKPYLPEPYFYRAVAKISLDDYSGAESDASKCIEINPFIKDAYRVRAVARHNTHKYEEAIGDYKTCLQMRPEDPDIMLNMAMCELALKNYTTADSCLTWCLERDSTSERACLGMAQLCLDRQDSIGALNYVSRCIERHKNNPQAYLARCEIYANHLNDYSKALEDIDEVIKLEPSNVNYYINRSYLRYQVNDIRGTMADLDYAIAIAPNNVTAHYNRALLRSEVGDYNKAVEDYDFVLEHDPDNYPAFYNRTMMLINIGHYQQGISGLNAMLEKDKDDFVALYQRAMLYIETKQYQSALKDLNSILAKYPKFESGYMLRAQIKQRLGDKRGYEKDLETAISVMKAKGVHYSSFNPVDKEREHSNKIRQKRAQEHYDKQDQEAQRQREMMDGSLEESVEEVKKRFSQLLVVDVNNEIKPEVNLESDGLYDEKAGHRRYRNKSRGYIQDNNVDVQPQSVFSLSYYSYDNKLNGRTHFMKEMTQVNELHVLTSALTLVCGAPSLSEYEARSRFNSVDYFNGLIATSDVRAIDYFGRAMDFFLLKNVDAAIADADRAINASSDFALAYFLRFNARMVKMQLDEAAELSASGENESQAMLSRRAREIALSDMVTDLRKVIALSPRNIYAYYNLGYVQAMMGDNEGAMASYSRAIELKPDLGEAYFNRSLIYLQLGDKEKGTADLSKAGELGILPSYNILKRMTR
ncbi:MAG: tetratricopeptide repeat protein [Muribaculaceae bacterium]|nr:tetratricopeptide repeat protein [Muribaculaceae bacterium]